jgi:hypothetical protein
MPSVDAVVTVPGTVAAVERAWYDTGRWRGWVDGFEELVGVTGSWPGVGAVVRWRSFPAGRGSVTETVREYESGAGQVVAVTDDTIEAQQTVTFAPDPDGVEVLLTLNYRITQRSIATPVFERLFVSRAMRASVQETLDRFAAAAGQLSGS